MAALLASALAGVLVAATFGGRYALAGGLVLVQTLLLLGVVRSTDVPAMRSSAAIALMAGAGASVAIVVHYEGPLDPETLSPVLVAVGAGFVALVILQLARRDGRDRLTASLSLGVMALALAGSTAIWLGLGDDPIGEALLVTALAGTATAAAIAVFPGPGWLWAIGGAIGAASVGLIAQAYVPEVADTSLTPVQAALVAGACGLAAATGLWGARLIRDDPGDTDAPKPSSAFLLLTASLPLALAAPVAFSAGWAITEGLIP